MYSPEIYKRQLDRKIGKRFDRHFVRGSPANYYRKKNAHHCSCSWERTGNQNETLEYACHTGRVGGHACGSHTGTSTLENFGLYLSYQTRICDPALVYGFISGRCSPEPRSPPSADSPSAVAFSPETFHSVCPPNPAAGRFLSRNPPVFRIKLI